jgi:hypothetical protein
MTLREENPQVLEALLPRHSFNSALANAGVPEEVRMKLTGHATAVMNAQYTHLQAKIPKDAGTKLPLFRLEKSA